MADKNQDSEEYESFHRARQTDNEIREIKILISGIHTNSEVNKANLRNITFSLRDLANNNTETHGKLFARTDELNVAMGQVETRHNEHVKHSIREDTSKHARYVIIFSCVAIAVSIVTAFILAIQAKIFS